ncbi:hypothetical protein I350_07276 [Cryptococcus amylolentus CBS 6273]|uniref:Major facilitator superfamily (MFS) profile domain-containing protein n=1 Tax=Cryptococcus amylolentus CBS 6273 TaxID=1296118 RepID=A0A1E3JGS8_9TREE|nr:hypothetical protein I350_07276 [Cryptococcus amylolentus CBS 6273]
MSSERTPLIPSSQHKRESLSLFSRWDYALILPVLLSNNFLAAFESTIAASTQTAVGADFRESDNVAWVAISYLIVSTAAQPLYGRASDIFGRTTLYVLSLSFFAVGCLGCAMSASLSQMVVVRAMCGIGGGGLITVSQVCAWDVLPVKSRPAYQAVNNVTYGVGAAVGASLGGLFSDSLGWRFAYLFPVPLSILSILVFVYRARPKLIELHQGEEGKIQLKDIDVLGSGLLLTAITLLMIIINLGGDEIPWTSPLVPTIVISTGIIAFVFFRHEAKASLPVLPIGLIKSRHMVSQVGMNLFGAMVIFGVLYLIPPFFQSTLLTTASLASLRLLYPTLTAPLGSILTGIFLHHHPHKAYLAQRLGAGVLLAGTGIMLSLAFGDDNGERVEGWFVWHLVWVHAGMGILFISSLLDVLSASGSDHAAATSLILLLRSLGSTLGIASSQSVLQNTLSHQLSRTFTGPGSDEIIAGIRQSVDFLKELPERERELGVRCWVMAFRAAFGGLVGVAGVVVVFAVLGICASKQEVTEEAEIHPSSLESQD